MGMPRSTAKVSKLGSKSQDDKKSQKKRQSITYKPSTSKRGDDKKKIRFHPGTVALREIHALQKRTHMLIQKRPFQLLVRNVMSTIKMDLRWRPSALEAVQEATEHHIVSIFEHAVLLSVHRQKKTVIARDLDVVMRIRERLE